MTLRTDETAATADARATAHARAVARARVRATRRTLAAAAGARAALWGATAGVAAAAVARLAGAPPAPWATVLVGAAAAAAGGAALARAGAGRGWSLADVALWVEARVPALGHALVTLVDAPPDGAGAPLPAPVARALEARVDAASRGASGDRAEDASGDPVGGPRDGPPGGGVAASGAAASGARWPAAVARAARRAVVPPAGALAGALLLLAAARARPAALGAGPARGPAADGRPAATAARALADPLARLRVTVTPPPYAREPARTLDAPAGVAALVGSVLTVEGAGDAAAVRAVLDAVAGGDAPADGVAPAGASAAPSTVAPATAPAAAGPDAAPARRASGPRPARPLAVRAGGDGWRVALAMPARPAVLRLAGPARGRLVVLEPRADLPPRVTLELPARDTVLRAAAGAVPLRARADDDLGLAGGAFEWVVSSGEGENFTFRGGRQGAADFGGARRGTLGAALDLAALALKPGDVVHVRAVARDRRPGGAPGASETRALRVARAGEYDSVAVEGAPPPAADTTALGQRMLLQLTEALVARAAGRDPRDPPAARPRRAPLARDLVAAESRRIGADQARLRRRVGDAVFARAGGPGEEAGAEHAHFEGDGHQHGEGERLPALTPEQMLAAASRATGGGAGQPAEAEGESPVVAVNRPLLEAYNHMWDAGRALEIAEPARAVAPMRRAIAALQRARAAERVYLRGRPPAAVVDVNKVRLAGGVNGDTLAPAPRTAALYAALDPAARGRALALDRALAGLARGGAPAADAADSLALLRVRALGDAPALAAALGDALAALARGGDASAPLARARRAAGAPAAPGGRAGGAPAWGAPWADLGP